jgi:hypothetical protein
MKVFLKPWWGKVIAVILVLLLIASVLAGYVFWQMRQIFPRAIPFNGAIWQAADTEKPDNPRCLMQRDLEQNHLNRGMTRAEVTSLLGETKSNEKVLSYYLGFCNPFGVDGESLELEFDGNDKLINIRTIQH